MSFVEESLDSIIVDSQRIKSSPLDNNVPQIIRHPIGENINTADGYDAMSLSSSDISDNTITTGADFSRQEAEVYSSNQFFENVVLKRQLSWQNYQNKRRSENNINNFDMTSPSIAFISELSKIFAFKIKELCHTRDLFCSREYPLSFTGEEALNLLSTVLQSDWTRRGYRVLARSLMHTVPPLFSPVPYSEKSLKHNTFYDSQREIYTLSDINEERAPQGLFLPALGCYSTLCASGLSNGCYSPCCPYKSGARLPSLSPTELVIDNNLHRNLSVNSSLATSQDTVLSRAWSANIPRELLQSLPAKEINRQEALNEFIYTEEDYVRDLNLLDELFATPLLTAQCIEENRRDEFHKTVFGNYMTFVHIHRELYRELRDYQLYCQEVQGNGFIDEIGIIFLKYIDKFKDAYVSYGSNVLLGEYEAKQEMANNILFHNFIREKEKQAETRKLAFRHFILAPISRLQRYPLLLNAILKRTNDQHPDRANIVEAIQRIKNIAEKMDLAAEHAEQKLRLKKINACIQFKSDQKVVDLELLKPERRLLYEGPLKRRSHLGVEMIDIYVFLFDHLLLMTHKNARTDHNIGEEKWTYTVSKRPIPLNLLTVKDATDIFLFNSFKGIATPATAITSPNLPDSPASTVSGKSITGVNPYINQPPLLLTHLGRDGGEYVISADTPKARLLLKESILRAKKELSTLQKGVFQKVLINEPAFALSGIVQNCGRVICSAQYVNSLGKRMNIIGAQQSIWMYAEGAAPKRVLVLSDITQISILKENNILCVLADRTLRAYSLLQLESIAIKGQKLLESTLASRTIASHISYFNSGVCNDKNLIVTMKRKGVESHFKVYEPTCGDLSHPKNSKYLTVKTSFISKSSTWFKVHQSFYIGGDSSVVHFLRAMLLVRCNHGFEIINLDNLGRSDHLPKFEKPEYKFIRSYPDSKPLDVFRCKDNFLVCYNRFAFLMSTHGDHIKHKYKKIEWQGTPQSMAFQYPYVLAFDDSFIEVHHVETGNIVQIIEGESIKHLPSAENNTNSSEGQLCGTMLNSSKTEYQDIFKLVPKFN